MTAQSNEDQIAYWNGKAGEKWAQEQAVLDRVMEPFAARLLQEARITAGMRVLDVGCGCGTPTLRASSLVGPTGSVVGVDISAPMIEKARAQSSGRANVQFVLADASTEKLDASFDVVMSRFGVMFFADPVAAFANLRSAMEPGGALTFVCWRAMAENPWASVPREITLGFVPPPEPSKPGAPGPFAFADRARIESILKSAGFGSIDITAFDADVVISETGIEDAVEFSTRLGPAGALLREAPDDVVRAARAALPAALAPFLDASKKRVAMPAATWIVHAT